MLNVACDIDARLYRGRCGRTVVSEDAVPLRNCRRYLEASDSSPAFSSFNVALPSEDSSEKTQDERFVDGVVGDRGWTMS